MRSYLVVIVTFGDRDTERLAAGERVRRFASFEAIARRKLRQLEIAGRLGDLKVPPGLCRFFGLFDGYWLQAKAVYDTEVAKRELAPELKKIKPWSGAAA
jgi:hypothetical protein